MFNNKHKNLTDLAQAFLTPTNSTHRQYEALRAFFVEGLSSHEAARRFGYSPGSFRVLACQFRQEPRRPFFLPPAKGPHRAPKSDPWRLKIVQARKQNLSIYDLDNIPIPEYVVFLNPHLGPGIYRVQKSLANIGMYLEREIVGC